MTSTFDGLEMTTQAGAGTDNNEAPAFLSIIWLHGLGADSSDFAPVVTELEKLGVHHCRFIFPNAPIQAVTINGGMKMRSWYDITSLDFKAREQDREGIQASANLVKTLIQRELDREVPAENIMLAGFSQGGAVVLHTVVRLEAKIAGVIALSTYLPLTETIESEKIDANQHTPVFMAHGQRDDVIEQRYAQASRDTLLHHGYSVHWKSYDMAHSLSMEEIVDLAQWITTTRPR